MNQLTNYDLGILSTGAVIAGIWMLIVGGGWAIDAAVAIANRFKLSKVFIGATIIAFGTSVPELFTSVNANLSGYHGISLGNVIGSNIANILLVVGAASLFATLTVPLDKIVKDLTVMLLATAVLVCGFLYGVFTFATGALMFGFLVCFIILQYRSNDIDTSEVGEVDMTMRQASCYILAGFVGLALGSELLVRGAVVSGGVIGMPEAIIGMTAVAIGTSLPELSASISAVKQGEIDLMFGNIIGSNTFNILSILGVTAMTKDLAVDPSIGILDVAIMTFVALGFAYMLFYRFTFTRKTGVLFLFGYLAFTVFQFRAVI